MTLGGGLPRLLLAGSDRDAALPAIVLTEQDNSCSAVAALLAGADDCAAKLVTVSLGIALMTGGSWQPGEVVGAAVARSGVKRQLGSVVAVDRRH